MSNIVNRSFITNVFSHLIAGGHRGADGFYGFVVFAIGGWVYPNVGKQIA